VTIQKINSVFNPKLNIKIDHIIQDIKEKTCELSSSTNSSHQFEIVGELKQLNCKSSN